MHFFCSAFSGEYCYQGIVLYNSIKKHDEIFRIFYVCIDQLAYEVFSAMNLENLVLINAEQIEDCYPELKQVKTERAINEYAWTLKSSEMLYIFDHFQEVDRIIWLDGDTQILSNPQDIFEEWGKNSIILTEQYYTGWHEPLIQTYGRFQAGFIGFSRDKAGLQCLNWWQKKCIEWCYVRSEEGRWADQKYLDSIPEIVPNTCIVKSLGINMTPFILYRLNDENEKYIEKRSDGLYIDGIKVILFHYYGFRYYDDSTYDLCSYWMKFSSSTIDYLYLPYIKECKAVIKEIESQFKDYRLSWKYKIKRITNYLDFSRHRNPASIDFATIVKVNTLKDAIAQYLSISRHEKSFYWLVCCIDAVSYRILKSLKLQNTTIVYVDHVIDGVLRTEIKKSPLANKIESLKGYFLKHILKNNFAIKQLLYLKSDYYLLEPVSEVFSSSKAYDAILFNKKRLSMSNQNIEYERDIIGFQNNKGVVELLLNYLDSQNQAMNLNDKLTKYLSCLVVGSLEYNCTLTDLKYIKYTIKNGKLYINNQLIRIFRFYENRSSSNSAVQNTINAKNHLNNEMCKLLYDPYKRDLNFAVNQIKRFQL